MRRLGLLTFLSLCLITMNAWAAEKLKPYIMVSNTAGDVAAAIADTKSKLDAGGFRVLGEYSPYAGANVIVVTSDALLAQAAKSEFGGYGAVVRVSVTKAGDNVQVAYANPVYWAAAYQMQDLGSVAAALSNALGEGIPYGSEKGLTADQLNKYHYMAFMPYFKDHDELGSFGSHAEAVAKVNERLASVRSYLRRWQECSLLMSHASSLLTGLVSEFSEAEVADQTAGTQRCLSRQAEILDQVDDLYRVRTLYRVESGESEPRGSSVNGERLATHVLCGDLALPLSKPVSIRIGENGPRISSELDDGAALTVVMRNRSLETLHLATDVSIPQTCRPGESIRIGGHELKLIRVRDD